MAAFSCTGLEKLSRAVGFGVMAVAVVRDPSRHASLLTETRHGCGVAVERAIGYEAIDLDDWLFRDYAHVPFDERWLGGRDLSFGMVLEGGSLLVPMPPGVCLERFARKFRASLGEMRFDQVAQRPTQCTKRFESGRRVAVGPRYSFTGPGDVRPVIAEDLVAFRARDLPRLAQTAARVLVELAAANL